MTKKTRRTATKYGAAAKRRRRRGASPNIPSGAVAQAPSAVPAAATARPVLAPSQPTKRSLSPTAPTAVAPDHSYVPKELRTIGVITGALLVITFALILVLR